jgi:hypothetical protein
MKILLTNAMADELLNNEDQIKNQTGAYRPHFDPVTKSYLPVIKCWPLEDFKGTFNQERDVIPGMEGEVDDIAMATIQDGVIRYKLNQNMWKPKFNPVTKEQEPDIHLDNYSILIYTPKFDNETIFFTANNLSQLFDKLKEYQIVSDKDLEERNSGRMSWKAFFFNKIDDWFKKYQGICTYILLEGDSIWQAGKFDNKKEW